LEKGTTPLIVMSGLKDEEKRRAIKNKK